MLLVQSLPTSLADHEAEMLREQSMTANGIVRFRDRQNRLTTQGAAAERDDYSSVIRRSLLGVVDRFNAWIGHEDNRKAGKRSKLLLKVKAIEGVTVAYITLSTVFNSLHKDNDKNKIVMNVGSAVEMETKFHYIAEASPKLWKRLVKYAKERGSYRHKTEFVLNTAKRKENLEPEDWSLADKAFLGEALVGLLEAEGLITTETSTNGKHRRTEVWLSEAITDWLEEHRKQADEGLLPMVHPVFAPMTEKPRDWTTTSNGGYRTIRQRLVKGNVAWAPQESTAAADLSRVYQAVNSMQATAWRLNPVMLALVEALWSYGEEVGKLPSCHKQPRPPRLSDDEWNALTPEQQKGHRLTLRELHADNRQATSDLASISMVLDQARELKDTPRLYIPYQLDFRGRAYCCPLLNPQGPDYIRCLFEFADGKAVGERGAMWLAIQCASLWDGEYQGKRLSKSSFQARHQWTEEHEDLLRSIVADPLGDRRWLDADKPFMFLRTAMDWVSYLDLGVNFVSHVPIALDGACSGIQHYSAILRDADSGASVNLVQSEEPADVYSEVAEIVIGSLTETPSLAWKFWTDYGVTRKVVKTPTMTYGYSSRLQGFTEKYRAEFVRPALRGQPDAPPSDPIARYLAEKTLAAVEQRLPAVKGGMDWLMTCAKLLAHEGKPISWTAPSGFRVVQGYMRGGSERVETYLGGEKLRVYIPGSSPTISKEKQKSAISPNHTHSLDAAHLVLTVIKAAGEYGIVNFALIHDSFGTLAADTDSMFSAVREAFVEMYEEHDPFQHLYEEVYMALSEKGREKLPEPPAKGDLDLSLVLQSLYAFA